MRGFDITSCEVEDRHIFNPPHYLRGLLRLGGGCEITVFGHALAQEFCDDLQRIAVPPHETG